MTKPLLTALIAGLFVCRTADCPAADTTSATAYTALRSMGKSLGAEALSHVVEMTGRGGTPQPKVWRIVIIDPAGGSREVKVSGARIVSQKASEGSPSRRAVRLEDLNLDSSGAFEAANAQARKSKVPFTALNYSLRVSEASGKPVWDLELINDAGTHVGDVRLAAHDGKLLSVGGLTSTQPAAVRPLVSANADHDSVRPTGVSPSQNTTTTTTRTYTTVRTAPLPPREENDRRDVRSSWAEGGFFSRAGRTLDHTTDTVGETVSRTGQAVDRTMRRTGAKVQRFFTGSDRQTGETSRPD